MLQVPNFKFQEKGTTLIEIIAVITIITLFSMILIADFPKIIRQYAVSRSSYKLSQDIRRVEDLGLSGVQIEGQNSPVGGYGLYIDLDDNEEQYIIYADNCSDTPDFEYTFGACDSIVETIGISEQQAGIYIKRINGNISGLVNSASINFTPPNPKVTITASDIQNNSIDIVIGSSFDDSLERTVFVNNSGLIEVK